MRTPRRAGEVRVSAAALTAAPVGPAPDPDPAAVARLIERRAADGGPERPVVGAADVARLAARRREADAVTPATPVPEPVGHVDDVSRLVDRRRGGPEPTDGPGSPLAADVARLAARRGVPVPAAPDDAAPLPTDDLTRLMGRRRGDVSGSAPAVPVDDVVRLAHRRRDTSSSDEPPPTAAHDDVARLAARRRDLPEFPSDVEE